MTQEELAGRVLGAWNAQDVERVLACYTPDLAYRDPNTRGFVRGRDDMRRYLTKLFSRWRMTWTSHEAHSLSGLDGYAALWRATLRKPDGEALVEANGMDLVILDGELISRNEVYFDRAVLAPLMGM